ncbi:MAG: hypothetical protein NT136_04055 [Candidatus Moranbacteria bacterium]|nr:hypothetical protein [Candidatus Moranbacteria bacterium]
MTIFKTNTNEEVLKKLIEDQDKSFYPLGTGGYSVRKDKRKKNSYILTEQDTAPANSYIIGVKGKEIWCRQLADFVASILQEDEIKFEVDYKKFNSPSDVTRAFLE